MILDYHHWMSKIGKAEIAKTNPILALLSDPIIQRFPKVSACSGTKAALASGLKKK
jgi:hypothetical protein